MAARKSRIGERPSAVSCPPNKAEEAHVTFSKSGLVRLKGGLSKAGLDARFFAWPPAEEPNRPPYRGLKPLEAEDAGIFFGREAPVIEALDRLRGLADAPARELAITTYLYTTKQRGINAAASACEARSAVVHSRLIKDFPRTRAVPEVGSSQAQKLHVFVSYSRRDVAAADGLVAALEKENIEVLIDRRDLPYGEEWQKELADFIRMSDTVLWLVSQDSVESRWVNWELGEVGRLSKRLIPVRIREINPEGLPESLGKIHLLPADCLFDISQHLKLLVDVLNTDRAWLKDATRLGDRARQWLSKERDGGLLLRGGALADAETWARSRPRSAPTISSEILDLIMNSRRATLRRHRQFVAGALTIAAVGIGLAVFSWQQRNTALSNQSTYLAKLSQDQIATGDVGTGLLLAISALPEWRLELDRPFVPEAARSLYKAIFAIRETKLLVGHTADVNTARYSSNDQTILTSSDDATARVWNAATGALLRTLGPHAGKVFGAQFSPDNQTIATFSEDNNVHIWDIAGQLRNSLSGHTDRVTSLEFDANTGTLISASRDATARLAPRRFSGKCCSARTHGRGKFGHIQPRFKTRSHILRR